MRFSVGQRVRVVSDEYDEAFVGAVGRVSSADDDEYSPWAYVVEFDQPIDGEKDRPFDEDEIVAVDVTIIEGVAQPSIHGKVVFNDDWLDNNFEYGKRYRITIEEVDDHA